MEKKITRKYIDEFMAEKRKYNPDSEIMNNLFIGEQDYSFINQPAYEDPGSLSVNIRNSVQGYTRDKDAAIRVYKSFLDFLKEKGISSDVQFPPIPISNSFERLMYIAKFLHDPERKISELNDELWQSSTTIQGDLSKLRGIVDPIQICGKTFKINETKRSKGKIASASTAHPLFLTPNLTQVIVMLKGLKAMSENRHYAKYAPTAAADIWEQMSDYAKKRIHDVLSDLMPEDLSWYENLERTDNHFHTEYECSVNNDVIVDTIKNGKTCFVQALEGDVPVIYHNCRIIREFDDFTRFKITSDEGEKMLTPENYIRSAYTPEELV